MTGEAVLNPEQLRFNSDALPRGERFSRYRDLYAAGADAVETGPAFSADVRAWRLDRAVLYDRRLNDVGHQRPAERLARDGFDHWTLTLLLEGSLQIDAGWGLQPLRPGEIALLDTTRPMANRASHAHFLTVSVARARMQATAGDLDALHGVHLPAEQAGLLGDYLQALARRLPFVPASAVAAVTQPIAVLLAATLTATGEASLLPVQGDQLRQLIERRLDDPAFNAAAAVAQSGLSRATLYRLFQPDGGLAVYIQRRRLNRVRAALADGNDRRSLLDIAQGAGFRTEGQCNRLFREAFGVLPRDFRDGVAANGGMEYLQEEVRQRG